MKRPELILGILLLLSACSMAQPQAGSAANQICFQGQCVTVELAGTDEERMNGLQFRNELDRQSGMLFIFSRPGPYSFWMKDTFIPLDMIWIDEERRIVDIKAEVPPCSSDPCPTYTPEGNALYVLELAAGKSKEWGLALGNELEFKLYAGGYQ